MNSKTRCKEFWQFDSATVGDEYELIQKNFFNQHSTIDLARNLLGKVLCRKFQGNIIASKIVETEAYLGVEDHASYTFGSRRTEKNEPMYMEAGTCFIRPIYGMYHCMNISSKDFGGAILLRALEPIQGIEQMIELRTKHRKAPKIDFIKKPNQLANGPSKLCIAMGIDLSFNKLDITNCQNLWLVHNQITRIEESDIIESTRIGINSSNPWSKKLLRYYLKENPSVSKF